MTPSVKIVAGLGVGTVLALAYRGYWAFAIGFGVYFGMVCWMWSRPPFQRWGVSMPPSPKPPPEAPKRVGGGTPGTAK